MEIDSPMGAFTNDTKSQTTSLCSDLLRTRARRKLAKCSKTGHERSSALCSRDWSVSLLCQRDFSRHLGGDDAFSSLAQGRGVLRQLLAAKAVLLLLDDVWRAADAQASDVLGPRCRMAGFGGEFSNN